MRVFNLGPLAVILALFAVTACSTTPEAPKSGIKGGKIAEADFPDYLIGPYDQLQIFVWRAPELSSSVAVRPDGRISTPLVQDLIAAGKTPTQLSKDIELALNEFVRTPEVTVIVGGFSSTVDQQVRVLGEARQPTAIPYQVGMTTLDVMIAVGGLTEFAAGNRAKLIRGRGAQKKTYRLRLGDLMRSGDVSADVPIQPGDVILIPESIF